MKRRTRTYYTDAQKALMWERWKQGRVRVEEAARHDEMGHALLRDGVDDPCHDRGRGAGLPPQLCVASGDSVQLTVSDVLSILQSVVRSSDCPLDRCDRNCDGAATVPDALAALYELLCMIPEGCSRYCGE